MGSEDRVVREKQQAKAVAVFEARKAALAEKGLDEKAIGRDPAFRAARAKVKEARARVVAIDARAAHVKEMAEKTTKAKKDKKGKGGKGKAGKAGAGKAAKSAKKKK